MTREDIFRMAQEVEFINKDYDFAFLNKYTDKVERFAALVASAEREACAKLCETLWDTPTNGMATEEQFYGNECAKVIRARGQA